ncbi:MAG TPA: Ku protein [Chthoniobacterales bacterium]|jgi:DNA end-binding protein Ku|nr:Ku protein [Chthoniobacterales bacterium]
MRAIWKGSINFGLVYIPVSVYPATKEEKVSFRQLRKSDLSPIRYKKVAEADQQEVPADQIVKGFEYEKGKWITLSDQDFEKVQIESTHSVEITDFVEQSQINPKFFYKPYFLEPQKGGEKAYALLHKALTASGRLGVAKVAIQKREYLAAVKPDGLFLILELMHFAQEVLEPSSLNSGADRSVSPQELKMATALIDAMTSDWDPTKYQDQYQNALMQLIEEKAQKRAPAPKPAVARVQPNVIDMVAVLQQSLQRAGLKKKAGSSNGRSATRSTTALVKRKRRSVAA